MSDTDMNVYRELQEHLDKMPVGFPATESGIELKVLKHLFTPEEAHLALKLNYMPDPLKKIYRRVKKTGISIEELEILLDEMYEKGLLNYGKSTSEKGVEEKFFANAPIVIGMFEYQLGRLTKEFIADMKQYFEEAFFEKEWNLTGIPQLRTIPIGQSVEHEQNIANYDDLRNIIENSGGPIGLAECICRKSKDILGDPCKKTDMREICFSFRSAAEMYHEKGLARLISKKEALDILEKVEEAGLVLQPGNSQRPMCICCCCGCCCEVLTNQKKFDEPSRFFATNFQAEVDSELCIGCGICVDRCNMDAITIVDDKSEIEKGRCIGCGACVPTCPQDAISLRKKEETIVPPKNTMGTYIAIMDKKAELARMEKS
ncbi:MAG: 4Fe-4S dicluster domain-containing protein [Promethearchaeota archaeon]|nr:MAG: 4Fe-4S dicluster domain-containing protein [Candidatus Lokiarchaeota archaeon]